MSRGPKVRSWPVSLCPDPTDQRLWNVRGITGVVVFSPGVSDRRIAEQATRAINEHFDHGRDA